MKNYRASRTISTSFILCSSILLWSSATFVARDICADEIQERRVIDVINRLRQEPQWEHLESTVLERIQANSKFGPEVNAVIKVVDKDGTPRADALVVLCESTTELINGVGIADNQWESLEVPLAIQVSGENGIAIFDRVRRTHPGVSRSQPFASIATAQILVIAPSRAWVGVPLEPTSLLQEITIQLEDPGELTGKASGPEKQPFAGIQVQLTEWANQQFGSYGNSDAISAWNSPFMPRCKTMQDGTYRLQGVPRSGWAIATAFHHEFVPSANQDNRSVDLKLARFDFSFKNADNQTRTFQIVDEATKRPIAGVTFPLRMRKMQTGDDGLFSTNSYYPLYSEDPKKKLFVISVEPANEYCPSQFVFEQPSSDAQLIQIPMRKGRHLKGRVVDSKSGKGLPDVAIRIWDTEDVMKERISSNGDYFLYNVTSKADGSFEAVVPPRKMRVQLSGGVYGYETKSPKLKNVGRPSSEVPFEPTSQMVDAGNPDLPAEVVFRLEPVKPIRGVAVDSDKKPIDGLLVTSTAYMSHKAWKSKVLTNPNGEFTLIPPPGVGHEVLLYAIQDDDVVTKKIQLTPDGSFSGKPVELNFADAHPIQFITGLVFLNGEPAQDVVVAAYEQLRSGGGSAFTTVYSSTNFLGSGATDKNGRYRIPILTAVRSEVEVKISSPPLLADNDWNSRTVTLTKEENEVPPMEFRTRYGNLTIKGEVITPEGDPVVGATIHAIVEQSGIQVIRERRNGASNPEIDTHATTDENGVFVCRNLCEGKIQLQMRPGKAGDMWSQSIFQSFYTTGGTEDLVFVMNPKLAEPPQVLTPVKITPLPEFIDPFRKSQATSGKGFTIRGTILDNKKLPIKNVSVVVFAAKPNKADIPSVQPVHHPLCGINTQSDASGNFELHVPESNVSIRFYLGKPGYGAKVSGYISEDTQWNASLPQIAKSQSNSTSIFGHSTKIVDDKKIPVATALVAAMQDHDQVLEPDQIGNDPSTQLSVTDEKGEFAFAGESTGDWKSVVRPGFAFRLMLHGPPPEEFISRGFSVIGRVVDANGPVPGYTVCASSTHRQLTHRAVTDSNGVFHLQGLTVTFPAAQTEVYIYGDPNRRDERGWLRTRIIANPKIGEQIQLDDCRLDPNGSLRVALFNASGEKFNGNMMIDCRLRQHSIPLTLKLVGVAEQEFENLPSEPMILGFNPGRGANVTMIEPTLHRVGWQYDLSVALEPGDDSYLNLTVVNSK